MAISIFPDGNGSKLGGAGGGGGQGADAGEDASGNELVLDVKLLNQHDFLDNKGVKLPWDQWAFLGNTLASGPANWNKAINIALSTLSLASVSIL
ncbi:unnamed protein product [Miscanthus lutarioriparius]|uniref:Uncharacterized protein n=1 Tax=Miscanthus lutarioriparius TaxID=422564 RepID=A0A811QED4_9POAL|nr:unnamed protein product [Miscanthus lutarioriparius]